MQIHHHRLAPSLLVLAMLSSTACSSTSSPEREVDASQEAAGTYVAEWTVIMPYPPILWVTKTAPVCATVYFLPIGENYTGIRGSSQNLNWGVGINQAALCAHPTNIEQGMDSKGTGTGTYTVLFDGSHYERAKISLHATVNVIDANGVEQSVRMDVDDLMPTAQP